MLITVRQQVPEMKVAEFAKSADIDELPHLDLHCLLCSV